MVRTKKVLIIDDDYAYSSYLRRLLEGVDVQVLIAFSGPEGLKVVEKDPPNLILLDLDMPEMHGLEVLKILKSKPLTAKIPVIICSMSQTKINEEQAKALGALRFFSKALFKPASINEIKAILAGL